MTELPNVIQLPMLDRHQYRHLYQCGYCGAVIGERGLGKHVQFHKNLVTGLDPLAEYQAASNEIHDITDGPGQLAWAAFHRAWMDGVQAVQEQARAEGAIAERRRIRDAATRTGFEHQGRWYEQYHVPAALLDGDGDV